MWDLTAGLPLHIFHDLMKPYNFWNNAGLWHRRGVCNKSLGTETQVLRGLLCQSASQEEQQVETIFAIFKFISAGIGNPAALQDK